MHCFDGTLDNFIDRIRRCAISRIIEIRWLRIWPAAEGECCAWGISFETDRCTGLHCKVALSWRHGTCDHIQMELKWILSGLLSYVLRTCIYLAKPEMKSHVSTYILHLQCYHRATLQGGWIAYSWAMIETLLQKLSLSTWFRYLQDIIYWLKEIQLVKLYNEGLILVWLPWAA